LGDGLFELVVGLALGEDPVHRALHADPSPRPEPCLEIEVEERAQESLGVLDSAVDEPTAGRHCVDNTGDGGGGDEHFGHEEGEDGVQRARDFHFPGVALDEGDVVPAVAFDFLTGDVQHVGAEFYADDTAVGADALLELIEAEAGAAPEIQDCFSGFEVQAPDGEGADAVGEAFAPVVVGGVESVAVFLDLGVVILHEGIIR